MKLLTAYRSTILLLCRVLAMTLVLTTLGHGAHAQESQFTISPGHEKRIMSLFLPFSFSPHPPDRWRLTNVAIQRTRIRVRLSDGGQRTAELWLHHRSAPTKDANSLSFAIRRGAATDVEAERAATRVIAAVRANDDGEALTKIWTGMQASESRRARTSSHVESTLRAVRGALWLGLLLVLITWVIRRIRSGGPLRRPHPLSPEAWIALGTVPLWCLVLWLIAPEAPLYEDTARDLLVALDCMSGDCGAGSVSGFRDLHHHLGWSRFVALLLAVGVPVGWLHGVAIALHATSAALIFRTSARLMSPWLAGLATVCAFLTLIRFVEYPLLWHPSLMPLALALYFFGMVQTCFDGRSRWLLLAAVGAALSIEAHLSGWLLLLMLLPVATAAARRPVETLFTTFGTTLGLVLLFSLAPMQASASVVARRTSFAETVLILVAIALSGTAGIVWRRWKPAPKRSALVALGGVASVYLMGLLAVSLLSGYHLAPRHAAPVVPALGLLAIHAMALGLARLSFTTRQVATTCAVVMALLVINRTRQGVVPSDSYAPWKPTVRLPAYTLSELAPLARGLERLEPSSCDQIWRIRGPRSHELSIAMAFWQVSICAPRPVRGLDWRILRLPRGVEKPRLPPHWKHIPLGRRTAALVGPIASWLRPLTPTFCQWMGPRQSPRWVCQKIGARHWRRRYTGRHRELIFSRPVVNIPKYNAVPQGRPAFELQIPIRTEGTDSHRYIELLPERARESTPVWRIAALPGVAHHISANGRCARLQRSETAHGATLVLHPSQTSERKLLLLTPQLFESRPGERTLRRLLRQTHAASSRSCGR